MELTDVVLAFIVLAGLVVAFGGYNFFRYSVIIMGGVGGFFLGNMFFTNYLSGMIGEGVLHAMSGSKGASFVIAVVVLIAVALSYAFYNIMAPIVAGVGGGFFLSNLLVLSPGAGPASSITGFFLGLIVGISLGLAAVQYQRWVAVVFTALCGARIIGYAGAKLLLTTSIGTAIGSPVASMFSFAEPGVALEMAIFLELFIFITIAGTVVQLLTRAE